MVRKLRFLKLAGFLIIATLVLSSLNASDIYAASWPRILSEGMSGPDVKELQIRIAGWAASGPSQSYVALDGRFGPATRAALIRLQGDYGLGKTGVLDHDTQQVLNSLEKPDGSTIHFNWSEFYSHDGKGFSGGKIPAAEVKENVRRLMYKLEALRRKMGGSSITINSGFRSISYNASIGGKTDSQHMYGIAADILVKGYSTKSIYQVAETTGFSGLESYQHSWQHVDSRAEYPYGSSSWWWESDKV